METERFDLEAILHLTVHFLGVVLLFGVVLFVPVWLAVILMVVEIWQMKKLGNCFLTVFAHKRGYMRGMSYWQYVPHLLGVKNYEKANRIISAAITYALAGILLTRTIKLIVRII